MAYSPSEKYPGAVDTDPNYQGGKFRDNNPSTTNNGSPLKAIDRNELLARDEAIMNDAGFEYNGVADTPQDSQLFKAYKASLGNGANLLSNHNFLIASPDDSQPPPDATPRSYPPGFQIFSGVFANGTTGITNLTYVDGRVSFSGGDFYMPVPNTGAIARLTSDQLVSSVADFDGKPRTRGVSFALVGDEYRVTVGVDALSDVSATLTPLGSVKFEQGGVATRHNVQSAKGQFYSFASVAEAVARCPSIGGSVVVDDYYGGDSLSGSGALFFKVVPANTGVDDGGKYIDVDSTRQLEQILNIKFNPKAWGARLNGIDSDVLSIQSADNYVNSLGGGVLNFPSGTLFIDSTINKSVKTHWLGDVAINYFLSTDTDFLAGTKIRPGFDGVLISSISTFGDIQVGYCGLENFSCAGRLEESGYENAVIYEQSGDRVKGLKFKSLIFKRGNKGLSLQNSSFCHFEDLDFRFKENIDAPQLSDSEFIRCEIGSGLSTDPSLKSKFEGGYGLRLIGDNSAGSPYNGNNKFHRCRFQLAASTYANLRAEWMLNLKFFDCIFDQNEAQGGVFLNCEDLEFYGVDGFNNADESTPKWTLQFGQGGTEGCKNVKFFGGSIYNKSSPNANPHDGNGVLFSDTDYELHGLRLEDSLINKISGLSASSKIYGGDIPTTSNLALQNSWVENSSVSTPKVRKESNMCYVNGAIKDGVRTNGTVIFNLPIGYRPTRTKYVSTFSGPAPEPEWLQISTSGDVSISGGDWSSASLNGIDFIFDLVN